MVTNSERIMQQVWVNTTQSVLDRARQLAEKKRMRFSGLIGVAIEKYVEAENDERGS